MTDRPASLAAQALVGRVLPDRAGDVTVDVSTEAGPSWFGIRAEGGRLRIEASDGVSVAAGLRHYAMRACDLALDPGTSTNLPGVLPDHRWRSTNPWRWRYHLNYCTFGYSAAYWDWPQWEVEIDRMALAGVNLPLATVGFEGAWLHVLRDHGVPDERARRFLGSAAYLPWVWMGCVHDHGSPMPSSEIERRVELGRRILARQRELGMTPVLPGFTGYLPRELAGGGARPVDWMGFTNYAVDPRDGTYQEFGGALLAAQESIFGSDGFYAVDPFVEGTPPVEDASELADYATAIAAMLTGHDHASTWVLQGWPFGYRADYWNAERTAAFLGAMPSERSLVLDLWAEHQPVSKRTNRFAGRPWAWTMLHSLGGRPGLHGALDVVAAEPGRIRASGDGGSLVGVGSTMESLGHDPIVYELLADVAWNGGVDDLDAWTTSFLRHRYGRDDPEVRRAWDTIVRLCYHGAELSGPPTSIVISRPTLGKGLAPRIPLNLASPLQTPAAADELAGAWEVLAAATEASSTPGLERDVVEVGLDVLARRAALLQQQAVAAFGSSDRDGLVRSGVAFEAALLTMDGLADAHPDFRLGTWTERARAWGETPARADQLEEDAKRLLTCWVAPGHVLEDYAGRHWSGLVAAYYLPRWTLWWEALLAADGADGLDVDGFERGLRRHEDEWLATPTDRSHHHPTVREAAAVARDLLRQRP
ncbi:MAG: alpha-N-acetylglucosaminidase [Actinomycetota bacterium]|nr:alpha-N-acetylglucosaminidase [Actinomycetota bacterium]